MIEELVSLEQVKTHLRLGSGDREDDYLKILIPAALRAIANATDRDNGVTESILDERDKVVVVQASLLLIGHWYANREAVGVNVSEIPLAVQWLIAPLRVMCA